MRVANAALVVLAHKSRLTMLKERIITALFLIPVVIWCIFFASTTTPFMAFAGAIVVVGV